MLYADLRNKEHNTPPNEHLKLQNCSYIGTRHRIEVCVKVAK